MATAVGSILRAATRRDGEPLNILTFPTHESYEVMLCQTGHNFWAYRAPQVRDWNRQCRAIPANYVLLNPAKGNKQIPAYVDFDVVLSNNRAGQFQIAQSLSQQLKIPHINMEHTLPHPGWPKRQLDRWREYKADINLFISEYSREQWGWKENEAGVIHHGIDVDLFCPDDVLIERKQYVLTCVNDFINRDWCCGYRIWDEVTKGLPTRVRGNTPGLSEGTRSVYELIFELRSAAIYFNTSTYSPVPMALLEAMSCGCAIVSTATCMMPEIIVHGQNGYITNNKKHLREYLEMLLKNPEECKRIGRAARQTIIERFSPARFVADWNRVFEVATSQNLV